MAYERRRVATRAEVIKALEAGDKIMTSHSRVWLQLAGHTVRTSTLFKLANEGKIKALNNSGRAVYTLINQDQQ